MKKQTILIGTGAFILAIASVFASNANKRFASTQVWYKINGSGTCTSLISAANSFFTATSGTNKAKIRTVGNNLRTLYSNATCTATDVYFNL